MRALVVGVSDRRGRPYGGRKPIAERVEAWLATTALVDVLSEEAVNELEMEREREQAQSEGEGDGEAAAGQVAVRDLRMSDLLVVSRRLHALKPTTQTQTQTQTHQGTEAAAEG